MRKFTKMFCVTAVMAGLLMTGGCGGGDGLDLTVNLPDLTIAKSHVGNFSQGQRDATYTITVKNTGTADTSGVVTVVDTLPTGLTFANVVGNGWTVDPVTHVCTRTDVLTAGSSYPAITVTVVVDQNAGTPLINKAVVSGGGETNTANNTATDSTNISVNLNAAQAVSSGNTEPYDASGRDVTFEVHPASTFTFNITKFAAGDRLVFDAGTHVEVTNVNANDGVIDVIGSLNGQVVTVHMTGIAAASDQGVFGANSFRTVFGANSLLP
jgi:hypothetical protein